MAETVVHSDLYKNNRARFMAALGNDTVLFLVPTIIFVMVMPNFPIDNLRILYT